jgi:hypothetical protein
MKTIKITAKDEDAILCMIEYFIESEKGKFVTMRHGWISSSELQELAEKVNNP